ncbi:unnamed protein product [Caenorhabditis bovis]|uniref:Endoplasmic reticulum lectin 1 n=1 Tax=Caenorhabditis bovis TaxID=2654633 RepID=A0A8S1F4T2_9PELO|nr:unnamed protein product [Caenorhabditis bovis]
MRILLFALIFGQVHLEKIDDSIHYYLTFTNDASKLKVTPLTDEKISESDDLLKITTRNNERFVCKLPQLESTKVDHTEYKGKNPEQLLQILHNDNICSYLIDVYWTYEVCHGKYVSQYHEDRALNSAERQEFYLGSWHFDYTSRKSSLEMNNPPKKRIENEDYPYYSESYTKGTTCDITGKPRTTDVIYICVENIQHKILSVTEVSSCHYEVLIMTELLCEHPAYRLTKQKDHEITCWNLDAKDEESAKPRALQRLDEFHSSTFKREYAIIDDGTKDTADEEVEEPETIDEMEYEEIQKNEGPEVQFKLGGKKRFVGKDTLANNPSVVQHTVNSLLTGEDCLTGGTGFWQYEFCFGKHVVQYHEDAKGHRISVLLGVFDEAVHNLWVQEQPMLRGPRKIDNHITQITHLYSKGDFCEEAGGHRSVEVRLRCLHSEYSALAVSLMLSEPKTCEYVLTVDSERFCEPLQYADDNGLIKLERVEPTDEETEEDTTIRSVHQEF